VGEYLLNNCWGFDTSDDLDRTTALTAGFAKSRRSQAIAIPNRRFNRFAQVIARDGMYAGFAGAKTGHGCPALSRGFFLIK